MSLITQYPSLHAFNVTVDPHSNQWAHRLALKLVAEFHGSLCERIAESLLKHGKQTFAELMVTCNFQSGYDPRPIVKREDVKLALMYLVQLNLVNCYLYLDENVKGEAKKEQQYEAACDRMLQIIRTPRFVAHIREQFPDKADVSEAIITVLLEHGKLRADQVVNQVTADLGHKGKSIEPEVVRMSLRTLVYSHYIERAPPCDLPPPIQMIHPVAQKKRAAPKPGTEEALQQAKEQEIIKARSDWNANRFTGNMEMLPGAPLPSAATTNGLRNDTNNTNSDDEDEEEDLITEDEVEVEVRDPRIRNSNKRRRAAAAAQTNKRGKKSAPTTPTPAAPAASLDRFVKEEEEDNHSNEGPGPSFHYSSTTPAVLWRVNYDEFNRQFRNQEFLKVLAFCHDEDELQVAGALLKAAALQEDEVKLDFTPAVSVETVHSTLMRNGGDLSLIDVTRILSKLANSTPAYITLSTEGLGGGTYRANISFAMDQSRNLHLLATIKEKFGQSAARIWNLLLLEGQMEQKQVGDTAMLSKEAAREALYSMLRAGYLLMQDVPRSADHAPSRTFYTWRANQSAASARLAVDLYKAAGNIHKRLQYHIESNAEMTERVQMVSSGQLAPEVLQKEDFRRFRQITKVLQNSLLKLDEEIALFNDM